VISGVPRILEWEGRGAAGAEGDGEWDPLPTGEGSRELCPLPRKFFVFFVENATF